MATYDYLKSKNGNKIQVESAKRDGAGKNIENNYAKQNGYYQQMTVGNAENLTPYGENSGATDTTPFVFQSSGGSSDIGVQAYLRALRGNSVAWNQLLDMTTLSSVTSNNVTITNNGDGSFTVSTTSAGASADTSTGNKWINMINGHKYIYQGIPNNASNSTFYLGGTFTITQNSVVSFSASTGSKAFNITVKQGAIITTPVTFRPQIFDITLFGKDYSSILAFNRDYPLPYYPYNAGTLLSSKSNGYKTVGYNVFDGTFTNTAIYSNGSESSSTKWLMSDYIKVIPGQTYTFEEEDFSDFFNKWIVMYDGNKNYITRDNYSTALTLANNVHFVRIGYQSNNDLSTSVTYKTCFHLTWDSARTGYEPYETHTYALPNVELRSAGSVYDELKPDGTLIRRVGVVDLGTLNWTKFGEYGSGQLFIVSFTGQKVPATGTTIPNCIISKNYKLVTSTAIQSDRQDKCYAFITNGQLWINDSAYTDTATFKTAMSGVYLFYELATPTIEQTDNTFQEATPIDDFGTQEFLSNDSIVIPQGNEFFYPVDYKAFIDSLGGREDIEYAADQVVSHTELGAYYTKTETNGLLADKQDTLVSGTNIKTLNGTSLLGSGNIDYDSALNESSTNAVQNLVIAKDIREINYELAVIRESLFETILTELPYKVNYATEYIIPTTLSDDDGTHRVVYSETQLDSVEGNGVVVNQLIRVSTISQTLNGLTITNNNDGSVTVSGTATDDTTISVGGIKLPQNHKYLLKGCPASGSSSSYYLTDANYPSSRDTGNGVIYTYAYSWTTATQIKVLNGTDMGTGKVFKPQQFDLTQMFGSGNEPTTLDDNRIKWLLSQDIAYNTGEIKNTSVSGLTEVGTNKFDGVIIGGDLDETNGETFAGLNNRCVCQNFVKVFPSTYYTITCNYFKNVGKATRIRVCQYDMNYNFIGFSESSYAYNLSTYTIQTMSNAQYLKFALLLTDSDWLHYPPTQAQAQVMINVGNSEISYVPYQTDSITFPTTTLLGAFSAHDTLSVVEGNVVEGEQLYNIIKTSNVGTVSDLSSLTYYKSSNNVKYVFISGFSPSLNNTGITTWNGYGNIITNYGVTDIYGNVINGSSGTSVAIIPNDNAIAVYNESFEGLSWSEVKSLMTNVPLQYELATPTETTIATNLTFEQVSLLIQEGGSIGVNFTNVPPNIQTKFIVKKAVEA